MDFRDVVNIQEQAKSFLQKDDLHGALSYLLDLSKLTSNSDFSKSVVILLSRLSELESGQIRGTISGDRYDLHRNKLREAILTICEKLDPNELLQQKGKSKFEKDAVYDSKVNELISTSKQILNASSSISSIYKEITEREKRIKESSLTEIEIEKIKSEIRKLKKALKDSKKEQERLESKLKKLQTEKEYIESLKKQIGFLETELHRNTIEKNVHLQNQELLSRINNNIEKNKGVLSEYKTMFVPKKEEDKKKFKYFIYAMVALFFIILLYGSITGNLTSSKKPTNKEKIENE